MAKTPTLLPVSSCIGSANSSSGKAYSLEFSNCARTAMMKVGVVVGVDVVGRMVKSKVKQLFAAGEKDRVALL